MEHKLPDFGNRCERFHVGMEPGRGSRCLFDRRVNMHVIQGFNFPLLH